MGILGNTDDLLEPVDPSPVVYYQINVFPQREFWEWSFRKPSREFDLMNPTLRIEWVMRAGPLEIRKIVKAPDEYEQDGDQGLPKWKSPLETYDPVTGTRLDDPMFVIDSAGRGHVVANH